jgi:hypothetical protein
MTTKLVDLIAWSKIGVTGSFAAATTTTLSTTPTISTISIAVAIVALLTATATTLLPTIWTSTGVAAIVYVVEGEDTTAAGVATPGNNVGPGRVIISQGFFSCMV